MREGRGGVPREGDARGAGPETMGAGHRERRTNQRAAGREKSAEKTEQRGTGQGVNGAGGTAVLLCR